jgi:hypothetical protein
MVLYEPEDYEMAKWIVGKFNQYFLRFRQDFWALYSKFQFKLMADSDHNQFYEIKVLGLLFLDNS